MTNAVSTFRNTIIQGDCLGVLPQLPANSVNFIPTDPPYITRYKSRDGRIVPNDDNDAWLKPAFSELSVSPSALSETDAGLLSRSDPPEV